MFKSINNKYYIYDELHCELQGVYDTFELAIEELKQRAKIPWNTGVNTAPCSSHDRCGRNYEIEFTSGRGERVSIPVLEIASAGVAWKYTGKIEADFIYARGTIRRYLALRKLKGKIKDCFPKRYNKNVQKVLKLIGSDISYISYSKFRVHIDGEALRVLNRIWFERSTFDMASLNEIEREIFHCIFAVHGDGYAREVHARELLNCKSKFIMPFMCELLAEYVIEIINTIEPAFINNLQAYHDFMLENPIYYRNVYARIVSYWGRYFKSRKNRNFKDHIASKIITYVKNNSILPAINLKKEIVGKWVLSESGEANKVELYFTKYKELVFAETVNDKLHNTVYRYLLKKGNIWYYQGTDIKAKIPFGRIEGNKLMSHIGGKDKVYIKAV